MVAKCANHSCAARFLYLHEGALFSIESGSGVPKAGLVNGFEYEGTFHHFQYFWLCARCSKTMTLRVEGKRVIVVRRERRPSTIRVVEGQGERVA